MDPASNPIRTTQTMEPITLVLLGVASNLLYGTSMMERLDFEAAGEVFGRVVAASNQAPQMAELARWLRAEAARKADRADEARTDLEWLAQHANDDTIRVEALRQFRQLAGSRAGEGAGSAGTLVWTFRRLAQEAAQGRWNTARQRVAGFLGELADRCADGATDGEAESQPGAGIAVLLQPWTNARVREVTTTDTRGELLVHSALGEVRIGARRTTGGWIFDRLVAYRPSSPPPAAAEADPPPVAANVRAENMVVVGPSPARVIIGGADAQIAKPPIAVATTVVATNAPPAKLDLSDKDRRQFEQWILDLASDEPVVRARARAGLRGGAAAARGVLQAHRDHPDVEVSATVRELLDELR